MPILFNSNINVLVSSSLLEESWRRKAIIAGTAAAVLSPRISRETAMGISRRADSQGNEDLARRATEFANKVEKYDITSSVGRQYMGQQIQQGVGYVQTRVKSVYDHGKKTYDDLPPDARDKINRACKFGMTAACIAVVNELKRGMDKRYGQQAGNAFASAAQNSGLF